MSTRLDRTLTVMTSSIVWHEERCTDCNALIDVQYLRRLHATRTPMPRGFHIVGRCGRDWSTIEAATGNREICECVQS